MILVGERQDELLDEIRAAIAGSDIPDKERVVVTDDGNDVERSPSLRAGAVVVYSFPRIEYPAPRTFKLTWVIAVVAAGDTTRAAANRMQAIIDVLDLAKVIRWPDKADATDFQLTDQSAIPGYVITHTEEHRR